MILQHCVIFKILSKTVKLKKTPGLQKYKGLQVNRKGNNSVWQLEQTIGCIRDGCKVV